MTRQRFRQVMRDKAWKAWRIEHDLVWPLGFMAVLLLTTAMAHGLVDELAHQQSAVLRSAQVGHELQNLSQSTVDVESGTRGLALTGDQSFLASAATAVPEARACLARLRNLTGHDPLASASIDALAQVVELRLQHALAMQARVIAGKVILQSDLLEGKHLQDQIRALHARIATRENALRQHNMRIAAHVRMELKVGLALSMLVLGGFGVMWFRARRGLRRIQENYRHLFDSAANGMALIGTDARIVQVNASYAAMLGYDPEELVGRDHCAFCFVDDQPQARANVAALLAGADDMRTDEMRFRRADGTVVWIRSALSRARGTRRGMSQVLMVSENVTERRRSDEALRRSAILLRNAGRMAAIDGWFLGLPHGPVQLGASLRQWLDLDGDDAPGLLARLGTSNRRTLLAVLAACRRTGAPFDIELEIPFGAASLALRVMGQAVRAPHGVFGIDGAVQDISLQKRIQRNLQKSEGRFRAVAQVTNDGIWDWDLPSGVIWRSPSTALLLGIPPGELGTTEVSWHQRIHPDDRAEVEAALVRATRAGLEEFTADYRVRRVDGSYASVHDKARLLRDEHGAVVRVVGGIRDLTERRRSQQALMGMAASVPNGDSDAFFLTLLQHLIEATGADAGAIARPADDESGRMCTVAALVDGKAIGAMAYPVAGSPCAGLREHGEMIIADALAAHCPDAQGMPGIDASAYAGHRLDAADGTMLGVIFVLFRQPLSEQDMLGAILRVFAARASAEMERIDGASRMREQAALLDQAREAIVVLTLDLGVRFWNKGAALMMGRASQDMLGASVLGCYAEPQAAHSALASVLEHGEWRGDTVQCKPDGAHITVDESWTLVRDALGNPHSILKVGSDATEKRAAQEQIRRLAYYDTLTGLPNRRLLMDRIEQLRLRIARHGRSGALLFIDMDNFKHLNDRHGHAAGDEFLRQSAQRLTACVRAGDTVARLGGDEFVILLDHLDDDPVVAARQARRIGVAVVDAFRLPVEIGEIRHRSTASVGITLVRHDGDDTEALLKQADRAMYEAKGGGRDGVVMASAQTDPGIGAGFEDAGVAA